MQNKQTKAETRPGNSHCQLPPLETKNQEENSVDSFFFIFFNIFLKRAGEKTQENSQIKGKRNILNKKWWNPHELFNSAARFVVSLVSVQHRRSFAFDSQRSPSPNKKGEQLSFSLYYFLRLPLSPSPSVYFLSLFSNIFDPSASLSAFCSPSYYFRNKRLFLFQQSKTRNLSNEY